MSGTVHVVGAGLAGLSAALRLASAGRRVRLWEATGHAGGRCRSYHDARLGRRIDNGNHLVLSGNTSVAGYLALAGRPDALTPAPDAAFPFVDLADGRRWTVRMNAGRLPWWIASPSRRVPGTRLADYLAGLGIARARAGVSVAEAVRDRGPLWRAFWEPMTLAVMNTTPERAEARLLWVVLRETFGRGAAACRPMFAPDGLGPALVDPALGALARHGVEPGFHRQLRAVEASGGRATALDFGEERVALGPEDSAILALPPARLRQLLPGIDPPGDGAAILNAHFVTARGVLRDTPPLLGVLGAVSHWIFVRGDVVSVTVSAADELGITATPREELAGRIWREVCNALRLGDAGHTAARIIVERRATFDQSAKGVAKRLQPTTTLGNLFLAGDATDTGLPATIEGAVRSGETAARLAA